MNKIQEMMDKLNSFDHPDRIADFLIEKGVTGEVQDGESCVISNWFLTETDALGCSTTEVKITVEDHDFRSYEMVPNEVVHGFITKFDDWQYPALISSDEDRDGLEYDGDYYADYA